MEREQDGALARALDRYKAWPKWARIGAPVAAVIVAVAALGSGADEEPVEAADTADAELVTTTAVVEEVDIASLITDVPDGWRKAQVVSIVTAACEAMALTDTSMAAAATNAAIEEAKGSVTEAQFAAVLEVVVEIAPVACPEGVESHPELMVQMASLAPATTTTTTEPPTTTTTVPPTTTAPPTTAPPTTAPPPPPTTHAPPPPPPAPAQPAASTHYKNCSEAHAAGVTPLYRGDPGYASHLDRDNDGVACEK